MYEGGERVRSSISQSRPLPLESGCRLTRPVSGPASPGVRPLRASPARPEPLPPEVRRRHRPADGPAGSLAHPDRGPGP
jgi:hypothetical protein